MNTRRPTVVNISGEDIFNISANLLVNPVNTVGIMGKGLALAFKNKYPDLNTAYTIYCQRNLLDIGRNMYYNDSSGIVICCMPTKKHWRDPSKIEYIDRGMDCLVNYISILEEPMQVAIPKIGCGLGGLNWDNDVRPLILEKLKNAHSSSIIYLWE